MESLDADGFRNVGPKPVSTQSGFKPKVRYSFNIHLSGIESFFLAWVIADRLILRADANSVCDAIPVASQTRCKKDSNLWMAI
jgi:hypothetical protein